LALCGGHRYPASDYLRALPQWLAEECPDLARICVLYAGRGTFGWQVARGILESVLVVAGQSVELVSINSSLENYDTILRTLFDIDPEVVVLLAVTFPDELGIMRTRQHRPGTVRVVAAVAGIAVVCPQLQSGFDNTSNTVVVIPPEACGIDSETVVAWPLRPPDPIAQTLGGGL
jgi:hypothetical protein